MPRTGFVATGGGGGGAGQVPAVTSAGTIGEALAMSAAVLGAQSAGKADAKMTVGSGAATLNAGTSGRSLGLGVLNGSEAISAGTRGASMAVATTGSQSQAAGSAGASMGASSSVLGVGFVTTAVTAGGTVWTNPTRVEADDGSDASWVLSEGIGAGAATTSTGTITATNPSIPTTTPAGWTRSKVETLVHRNDAAVGLNATGDTATFTAALQDKTGAALQTVVSDSFTAAGSHVDATVATDVTAAVAGVSDADLALVKFLLTATFARTVAATGTRSWTVNVDSLALRITYTRSSIT